LLFAATARARSKTTPAPALDSSYVAALAAADRFLDAWQRQDHEAGLLLLTDNAKHHTGEERLQAFFNATPPAAYEILRGRKLRPGRYSFPVVLFAAAPLKDHVRAQARTSQIVILRTGQDDWAVDKLP